MGPSISASDVKTITGIALVVAGLLVVVAGVWRADVSLITLGAGLLGAPGIASSVTTGGDHADQEEPEAPVR